MSRVSGHTVGEVMAYFRWKTLNGCVLQRRCFACDLEWDALQNHSLTDDEVTKP